MHSITFILNHTSFFHAFVSSLTFEAQSLAINIHKFLHSCTVRSRINWKKRIQIKDYWVDFFISKKIFRVTVEYLFEIISIFYSNRIDVLFTLYRYIYTVYLPLSFVHKAVIFSCRTIARRSRLTLLFRSANNNISFRSSAKESLKISISQGTRCRKQILILGNIENAVELYDR